MLFPLKIINKGFGMQVWKSCLDRQITGTITGFQGRNYGQFVLTLK